LSVQQIADEYGVSTKSVTRSLNELKNFLADHRELVGNTELEYIYADKCYRLRMDEFLTHQELFAIIEVLLGARAFSKLELLTVVEKMKRFTTTEDRARFTELIRKEVFLYPEVQHDCQSVLDNLWRLVECIGQQREITVEYVRMDRSCKHYRLRPVSVMFADHYFYLIAFKDASDEPRYFRMDRILDIVQHRKTFSTRDVPQFNEGLLRQRSLFMWPGPLRTIRFEFSGPSVQAVLDKLPTARIIQQLRGGTYLIEAETYGDGIKMWLLSQGSWVKVVAPDEFVKEMTAEITNMSRLYSRKQK